MSLTPKPAILFVDESGQFCRPHPPRMTEVVLVGGMCMPATEYDQMTLHATVAELRRRVHGSAAPGSLVKGKHLDDETRIWLAREIRRQRDWLMAWQTLKYTDADVDEFRQALVEGTLRALRHARAQLSLRQDPARARCFIWRTWRHFARSARDHPTYLMVLFKVIRLLAAGFDHEAIFPVFRVLADERTPRIDPMAMDLLGRIAVSTTYPDLFARNLSAAIGFTGASFFASQSTTDLVEDGFVLADIVCHAAGMIDRGQDEFGRYAEFFREAAWTRGDAPPDPVTGI